MRRTRFLAVATTAAVVAVAVPAAAQTNVGVTLNNTGSSRTLYVEDLSGQQLSTLAFGTNRSLPFRVRVVDSSFARQSFTVNATMTNLYVDDQGSIDHTKEIASSNVTLGSQATPLNVLSVSAAVKPVVDTVSTITDSTICATLGLVPSLVDGINACRPTAANLAGNVQNVTVPVDLSNLANLPLLPQANESGAFTNAEYGAGTAGAGDPDAGSAPTATARRLMAGSRVDTAAVLAPLHAALNTTVGTVVSADAVKEALAAQFPATWALLSSTQINSIVSSTVATVDALVASHVTSQSGTYISLPKLDVEVPSGAPAGSYRGTLVVTALQ